MCLITNPLNVAAAAVQITETNTLSGTGVRGISNTYGHRKMPDKHTPHPLAYTVCSILAALHGRLNNRLSHLASLLEKLRVLLTTSQVRLPNNLPEEVL